MYLHGMCQALWCNYRVYTCSVERGARCPVCSILYYFPQPPSEAEHSIAGFNDTLCSSGGNPWGWSSTELHPALAFWHQRVSCSLGWQCSWSSSYLCLGLLPFQWYKWSWLCSRAIFFLSCIIWCICIIITGKRMHEKKLFSMKFFKNTCQHVTTSLP